MTELETATTWISDFLSGRLGYLVDLEYAEPELRECINGVYAVHGNNCVYVGESVDCWNRSTLEFAVRLKLDCGIIRETPGASQSERQEVEAEVARLFIDRGFHVVSRFKRYA